MVGVSTFFLIDVCEFALRKLFDGSVKSKKILNMKKIDMIPKSLTFSAKYVSFDKIKSSCIFLYRCDY